MTHRSLDLRSVLTWKQKSDSHLTHPRWFRFRKNTLPVMTLLPLLSQKVRTRFPVRHRCPRLHLPDIKSPQITGKVDILRLQNNYGRSSNHHDDGQERHEFAYSTNNQKAGLFPLQERFFIFVPYAAVLVLSTLRNDLFCSCVDDVTTRSQHSILFFFPSPRRSSQLNPRIGRAHFASHMTWNNREMITETRSYIFVRRSRCRRCRPCLSSLMWPNMYDEHHKVSCTTSPAGPKCYFNPTLQ